MRLQDILKLQPEKWQLIKDCEFDILGMPTSVFHNRKVLCFLANVKFLQDILDNDAVTGFICTKKVYDALDKSMIDKGLMIVEDAKKDYFDINNYCTKNNLYWDRFENKIADSAKIAKSAVIAEDSVSIGENCIIEDGVVIHSGCIIGNNVIIRSGAQVGGVGFQFYNTGKEVFNVETGGRLIIKDNVEIQNNSSIDRGIFGGDTILNEYVKIGNMVHISHDGNIGARTLIANGVIIGGRVVTGEDCWFGLNATICNGINIARGTRVSLGSVVTKSITESKTVSGNFAIEHDKFIDFIKKIR